MIGWSEEAVLKRTFRGEDIQLSEHDLDITTIGNFEQFWTGRLQNGGNGNWRYCPFAARDEKFCNMTETEIPLNRIPTGLNEPLAFTYTDSDFMTGHNDVFNAQVAAFLSAITIESVQRKLAPSKDSTDETGDFCMVAFDFSRCFEALYAEFKKSF
jgi:hypothetical protein